MPKSAACFLCGNPSEFVEIDHGEYLYVKCYGPCPKYEISREMIKKLKSSEDDFRTGIKDKIKEVSLSGKRPVISYDVMKKSGGVKVAKI